MFTDIRRSKTWRVDKPQSRSLGRIMLDWRLPLVVGLALLAGVLAYQAPAAAVVHVGWLGDRLFLRASEGQTSGDTLSFYGDELTESAPSGRSRWTHQGAVVTLPGVGQGALEVTIRAAGWPDDVLSATKQPVVDVRADGTVIGQFRPTSDWQEYAFAVPAMARPADALTISLHASDTFTSTARYHDLRPKGVRVEQITIHGAAPKGIALPAAGPLLALLANGVVWLVALMALARRPTPAFILTTLLLTALALALTFARVWAALVLPWTAALGVVVVLGAFRTGLMRTGAQLVRTYQRGSALEYGLVAGAMCWVALGVAHLVSRDATRTLKLL
ncbi:MAG TPA: hypothetical protein VFT99_05315, partial [Roseiflexaceae bacterium]|nr:hypothetical protein [Roseiflexaceae bacterium]